MTKQSGATHMMFVRSLAAGILLTLLVTYLLHLFGSWKLENYRPDPETTASVMAYNTCAVFDQTHTLRPNYAVTALSNRIDQTKLAGSFMNFFDGHVPAMIALAAAFGLGIFAVRTAASKSQSVPAV